AQGATGLKGSTGAKGATGSQGSTGAKGATGSKGSTGAQGATGMKGSTGAQGSTGLKGSTGAQGATGIQGPAGVAGPIGKKGEMGNSGTDGVAGPAGSMGSAGENGTHCWDTNGNGVNDMEEDINEDGIWNTLDCKGECSCDYEIQFQNNGHTKSLHSGVDTAKLTINDKKSLVKLENDLNDQKIEIELLKKELKEYKALIEKLILLTNNDQK
ncbi:MAG: hypothetical protein V3V00_05085, partial [Saprospiraceae bacterium]